MIGTKHISDLITTQDALKKGRINIIDADVSAGKTFFALNTIPKWTNPQKILYLIDTTNGEMRIQLNTLAIGRMDYAFYDYNTKHVWGEGNCGGKMPVMTYAGFGTEVRHNEGSFKWHDFDYIICDEMQNLVGYQTFNDRSTILEKAEDALRTIAREGNTTIVAMSATPQKIRERFGSLCYDVPFDHSELAQLETHHTIPYKGSTYDLLLSLKGKRGILYTARISEMKDFIEFAKSIGMRANGFWSTSAKGEPLSREQLDLRETVLADETIPDDIDLLVINRASETCIKIQETNSKIDFMVVHDSNKEIQVQVRGRYHGDLAEFYYHDAYDVLVYQIEQTQIPANYFGKRLYSEDWYALIRQLNLKYPNGTYIGKEKLYKVLAQCGYSITAPKKDSKNAGKLYRILTYEDTIS